MNGMEKNNDKTSIVGKELQELFELEKWSNAACRGYTIKACESAGLDHETIFKVIQAFRWAFEEYTIKQAEQIYYNY
jgi:hypothetical protein